MGQVFPIATVACVLDGMIVSRRNAGFRVVTDSDQTFSFLSVGGDQVDTQLQSLRAGGSLWAALKHGVIAYPH